MAERRYQVVFYVAILIAAMGTYGVYRVLEATRANNRIAMAPVVVANEDMADGITVTRSNVSTKPWPAQTIPPGAYASVDSVVGRVHARAGVPGRADRPGRLAPAGTGGGLEVKIAPGKRAMSVKINDVDGISGLLQPNSRVDVLVTIRDESNSEARGRSVAKLFMSNMRVLSVGQRVQRATTTASAIPRDGDARSDAGGSGAAGRRPKPGQHPARAARLRRSGQHSHEGRDIDRRAGAAARRQTVDCRRRRRSRRRSPAAAGRRSRGRRRRWSSLRRRCRHPSHAPTRRRSRCTGPAKPSQQKFEKGDTTAASQPTTP